MSQNLNAQIGKRIRKARQDKGLTLAEVGKQLGISPSALGHIERGLNLVTVDHLLELPSVLEKPLGYFLPEIANKGEFPDPRLQFINLAWGDLPEFLKLGIYDMVKSAKAQNDQGKDSV